MLLLLRAEPGAAYPSSKQPGIGDNLYCPALAVCGQWSLAGSWQSSQPDGMLKRASPTGWRRKSQCRRSEEFLWKPWHRQKHRGCQPAGSESPPGRNTFCWTEETKDDRLPELWRRRGQGWGAHPFRRGRAAQWHTTRSSIQQGCVDYPNQEKDGKEQQ